MAAANSVAIVDPAVGGKNTWAFAGDDFSTTSWILVPDAWKRSCLTIVNEGSVTWYVKFGDNALTAVAAPVKSVITSNEAAVADNGDRVKADEQLEINLELISEKDKKRVAFLAVSGTSADILTIKRSSGGTTDG